MNNLSPKITFIILGLNIIAVSIEVSPPNAASIKQIDERTLLNLTKKTQEPQKASPRSSPPSTVLPRGPLCGGNFDRGHWLIFLVTMIIMAASYILERLVKRSKKSE
jgi:hypothetical protein